MSCLSFNLPIKKTQKIKMDKKIKDTKEIKEKKLLLLGAGDGGKST